MASNENTQMNLEQKMLCKNMGFEASEAYKLLRTNLMFTLSDADCRIVGITSANRGEAKSITSINLAYTIAETGKKVLLIDGDMRLPTVAKRLELNQAPGLSNTVANLCNFGSAVQKSGVLNNWHVLSAGDIPPNPSELLGSPAMDRLLEDVSKRYDFVIIDLPPVNIVSDAIVAAKNISGLLMVVRQNFTTEQELAEAVNKLQNLEIKILGFVMTGVEDRSKSYAGKYSKYGKYRKYGKYKKGYKSYNYSKKYDSAYQDGYENQTPYEDAYASAYGESYEEAKLEETSPIQGASSREKSHVRQVFDKIKEENR